VYRRRRRSVAIGFACADCIRSVESALIIAAKLAVLQGMHRACRRTADVCRNSPVDLARRVGGGVPALRGAEIDRRWRACGTRRSARLLRVCMPQSRDGPPRRHAGRNLPIGLASHSKRFVPGGIHDPFILSFVHSTRGACRDDCRHRGRGGGR
ncbi:hypothetical protein, partial [Burkholderia pseudomallei]|uniref:hypothetical protein n=1 Tax=Burkholderia pseudomallei TaxID=28450 RepID=UPI001C4C9AA1